MYCILTTYGYINSVFHKRDPISANIKWAKKVSGQVTGSIREPSTIIIMLMDILIYFPQSFYLYAHKLIDPLTLITGNCYSKTWD